MFLYVHHVHYAVENLDEAIDYFETTFGMKPDRIEDKSKGNHPAREAVYYAGITEIQVTEPMNTTSLLARHMAENGPGIFHIGWGVKQIDSIFDKAVEKGNVMRRPKVSVAPRGYKTVNIEPSEVSHGLGFQLIEDPDHNI